MRDYDRPSSWPHPTRYCTIRPMKKSCGRCGNRYRIIRIINNIIIGHNPIPPIIIATRRFGNATGTGYSHYWRGDRHDWSRVPSRPRWNLCGRVKRPPWGMVDCGIAVMSASPRNGTAACIMNSVPLFAPKEESGLCFGAYDRHCGVMYRSPPSIGYYWSNFVLVGI